MAYTKGDVAGDWNTIMEPMSAANTDERPTYPYNNATNTESGHSFEMDDTPDRERIRLQHRSNTFIEMHPNGDEVHKIWGDGYEIVLKNKKVYVKGSCTVVVFGDAALEVKGDASSIIHGNSTELVKGYSNITCEKDINITANSEIKISTGEDIEIHCKKLNVYADLYVEGDIGCGQSVTCDGNVTAGWDVTANRSPPKVGIPLCPVTLGTHIHPVSGAVTLNPVCFT